jgi:UDP-glucose 4-epimerase
MLVGQGASRERVSVYNVGSQDQIEVRDIAKAVVEAMDMQSTKLEFTGGVDNGRGWKGDVKNMLLDVSKILGLGWEPRYGSVEAVRLTAKELARGVAYQK